MAEDSLSKELSAAMAGLSTTGFSATKAFPLRQRIPPPAPKIRPQSGPGSVGFVYPKTRTEAIALYSEADHEAIRAAGASYPQSVIEYWDVNIDEPNVESANFTSLIGRSPRVFLGEVRYHDMIRWFQQMNQMPVGRPRTEELFNRWVNALWKRFDVHIHVRNGVNTPFPLYYSELYIHDIVQQAKKEVNSIEAEGVWAEFAEIYGDAIDLRPGPTHPSYNSQLSTSEKEFPGTAKHWFARQWCLEKRGELPENCHLQCPLEAFRKEEERAKGLAKNKNKNKNKKRNGKAKGRANVVTGGGVMQGRVTKR